jgi:hypothetical protein
MLVISNIKLEIYNEARKTNKTTRTRKKALFALGLALCLASACLMVTGNILGERTTGAAIVVSIIGIGLISTNRKVRTDKLQATEQNRGIQAHTEVTT